MADTAPALDAAAAAPEAIAAVEPEPALRRPVLSIRWIVTLTAVMLVTAAVLAVGTVSEHATRDALRNEIETRLMLQARNFAIAGGDALLSDFPELTLHPLARQTKDRNPELVVVELLDRDHRIVGDPDPRRIGDPFELQKTLRPAPSQQSLTGGEELLTDGQILLASVPVRHRNGRVIGAALIGLRLGYIDGVIGAARRQQSVVLVVVLVIGVGAALTVISLLLRPVGALRSGIERIGRGDLDTPVDLADRTELGMLADAVNRMAAKLKRAQVELVERERLSHELELAREIQGSLLPDRPTKVGSFTVQGANHAAQEVGGDYFDFFKLPDGRVGLAIADVAGKGLAGCMVMSMLKALLRAQRDRETSPAAMLVTLDAQLGETLQLGSFVTMFYGILDTWSGELVWASAGHSPLLVYRHAERRVEMFRTQGIPLGAVRGGAIRATLQDYRTRLGPGDLITQFTDGVSEAFDPAGREQFGVDRLERAVLASATRGADAVVRSVHGAVEAWVGSAPAFDDETLLVAARDHGPPPMDPLVLLAEARATGRRLDLGGDAPNLPTLRAWVEQGPLAQGLERDALELMYIALHEACTNVLEHGYRNDPTQRLELWCVPPPAPGPVACLDPRLCLGYFLIRDHASPFRPDQWRGTDFSDQRARKRGRGIGLDIIHRSMSMVAYHPATTEGNVTVLSFDPSVVLQLRKETPHA